MLASDRIVFLCIVGIAALLRILYTLSARNSPFFDHLDLDSRFYDLWAKKIAAGDWIGDEVFFMGPLYPYFLGLVYKMFGPDLVIVKVIQGVLGGLTAGVAYLLGREFSGILVGAIAGFLAALYVPFIFYDNSILLPVLAALLNTSMLFFLYVGLRNKRPKWFLISGIFAGFSAAGNASVLIFIPFVLGFLLLSGEGPTDLRLRRAGLLIAGIAVIVTPIMIRNGIIGKDLVPLTSNAGLNLYIGNNEQSTGAYVKPEELDVYTDPSGKTIAEAELRRDLKPSQVSRYWADKAAAFVKQNPQAFLYNLSRKFFLFWSVYEVPQIEHLPFEKRYSGLLRIPSPSFGIVCPLGIVGMILALRKRKEAWPLVLFVLSYSFTIVAFFVVARYRLPMVPALMVFAGFCVVSFGRMLRGRQYRPLVFSLAGFVVIYVLVHINFYRIDPQSGFAQSHYRLGVIHESKGNLTTAEEDYRKALRLDPSIAAARVNLGILLSRQARYDEAKRELLEAVRLSPTYHKAYYNLGLVYSESGMSDSALYMMDKAIELDSDYSLAKLNKAAIYYEMAQFARSESLFVSLKSDMGLSQQSQDQITALLKSIPQRKNWVLSRQTESQRQSDYHLLRGDVLFSLGLVDRALEAYLRAIEIDSLSAVALYQAGTLYFNKGKMVEALALFDSVVRVDPSYQGAHFAMGVISFRGGDISGACREFEAELGVNPNSSASHINLAMCYEEHMKDLQRAAYHLSHYIQLTGGTQEIREHLTELQERINANRQK